LSSLNHFTVPVAIRVSPDVGVANAWELDSNKNGRCTLLRRTVCPACTRGRLARSREAAGKIFRSGAHRSPGRLFDRESGAYSGRSG
jgi:hypothetical protein